jgi:hypothetical protein
MAHSLDSALDLHRELFCLTHYDLLAAYHQLLERQIEDLGNRYLRLSKKGKGCRCNCDSKRV